MGFRAINNQTMKFNTRIFLTGTFVVIILSFLSLISFGAVEEGTAGAGVVAVINLLFSKMFYLFRLPMHLFFSEVSIVWFFIGIVINCLIYGLVIERIITTFNKQKAIK
jgi:hypothetical protein